MLTTKFKEREDGSLTIKMILSKQETVKRGIDIITDRAKTLGANISELEEHIAQIRSDKQTVNDEYSVARKSSETSLEINTAALLKEHESLMKLAGVLAAGGGVSAIFSLGIGAVLGGAGAAAVLKEAEETLNRVDAYKEAHSDYIYRLGVARDGELNKHETKIQTVDKKASDLKEVLSIADREKIYFGVLEEIQLNHGLNIARRMIEIANFNGTTIDAVVSSIPNDNGTLGALFTGRPNAADIDGLVEAGRIEAKTPEQRALKQFVNHVVIPNQTYFELLASFADDARAQDLSTFPPLEIFRHKPVSFSGRRPVAEQPELSADELVDRAAAKAKVEELSAAGAIATLVRDANTPHLEKMQSLINTNEEEIAGFAGVFANVEKALEHLEEERLKLTGQSSSLAKARTYGIAGNKQIDARLHETNSRNQAKQKASITGSRVRGGLALGAGVALAMLDFGAVSGGVMAHAGVMLKKGFHDSVHSLTYALGQEVSTSVENSALDDYMASLRQQKVDIGALEAELAAVGKAIEDTAKSAGFQELLKNEAKRAYVAQTLLQRSLIRSGYNTSIALDRLGKAHAVDSVDALLKHYEGTRLGLALKKHCHGIADSNDMSIIITESDCLRGKPDSFDSVLQEYVEDTLKPNIGAFLSKASKMDVITQFNLSGFANLLHFPAEMELENNRAVRLLLANEFGMSVIGRHDVREMFDFYLHRYGDRQIYDEKIRDGEMSDEYPDKRVSFVSRAAMDRFVDMAKRSVASGRTSFPRVGDPFTRVCAYTYFLPQAIMTGGKDNIFSDYPESPSAYPLVNTVVSEFVKKLSFSSLAEYREAVGDRADNIIAQSFIDFFSELGKEHNSSDTLAAERSRVKDSARYDDYGPVFDGYTKSITRDALGKFDLFLDIYRTNLEKQVHVAAIDDRQEIASQIDRLKDKAEGVLAPKIVQPGSHAARLLAHDENHTGENFSVFSGRR